MEENVFKKPMLDYVQTLNVKLNYLEQAVSYVGSMEGVGKDVATKLVLSAIKTMNPRDPKVRFRFRKDNGDRDIRTLSLTKYLTEFTVNKEIIVPSMTCYDNPKRKLSLHSEFLAENIKLRNIDKKRMFTAQQKGDMKAYSYNKTLQGVRKTYNNTLSGTYGSRGTIIYNPSSHYTLTSMTRSVTSIGNAITESIVAGNKNFRTPQLVLNYLVSVVTLVNMDTVRFAVTKYDLHKPTTKEVVESLKWSSDRYWEDDTAYAEVTKYLDSLSGEARAAILYNNDLYHIRKYNPDMVRVFLGKLSKKCTSGSRNPLADVSVASGNILDLTHAICMDDLKGMDVKYKEMKGTDTLMTIASTANNIHKTTLEYKTFIKAFFVTDVLPIDIANIKTMLREVIVLSDTDSTCGAYDEWVMWYFGKVEFNPASVGLASTMLFFVSEAMDHCIKIFAGNMGISYEASELLKMKNEYLWSSFIVANVSKHYYASICIQEGNVYAKSKMDLKGVHLVASGGNQEIVSVVHAMMQELSSNVEKGILMNPNDVIERTITLEREVIASVAAGEIKMYKNEKIKKSASYKDKNPLKNKFYHHMLWESCFSDKYGSPGVPEYTVYKIPTILDTKARMNKYLDDLESDTFRENLKAMLVKGNKVTMGTFRVPMDIAVTTGLPMELLPAVDTYRVVKDNLNVLYIVLETMGLYRKSNLLFCEMGYGKKD